MIKYNPKNERIKREYYEWQKEANRKSNCTVDNIRKAIDRYEIYTKYEDFKKFNKHKAIAFKKDLAKLKVKGTGKPLSKATTDSILRNLKDLFKWLAYKTGYKRCIDLHEIEYFNLSEKELREAKSKSLKKYPSIEQIMLVLKSMSDDGEIDKRNKALIAFTLLTGIRDGAIASLKIKHIKLDQELVEQKPDEVKTKNSKTIFTYFFPVGDEIKQIFIDWIMYLKKKKLFNDNDPVFPRTKMSHDDNYEFHPNGIESIHWDSASRIRKIFKTAFESMGLDYYTPHSFRTTLGILGEQICKNGEQYKAWSKNLGHEHPSTTYTSYGDMSEFRQCEIIKNLKIDNDSISQEDMIKEIYSKIKKT